MHDHTTDQEWLYSQNSYETPSPYKTENVSLAKLRAANPSLTPIHTSEDGQQAYESRLAAYLIAHQLTRHTGSSQPSQVTVNISNSFNTTDSHNRKLKYHQQQLEQRPEKFSRMVPGLFFGFWAIAILTLFMSAGVSND
jgi:hypothetical protein